MRLICIFCTLLVAVSQYGCAELDGNNSVENFEKSDEEVFSEIMPQIHDLLSDSIGKYGQYKFSFSNHIKGPGLAARTTDQYAEMYSLSPSEKNAVDSMLKVVDSVNYVKGAVTSSTEEFFSIETVQDDDSILGLINVSGIGRYEGTAAMYLDIMCGKRCGFGTIMFINMQRKPKIYKVVQVWR